MLANQGCSDCDRQRGQIPCPHPTTVGPRLPSGGHHRGWKQRVTSNQQPETSFRASPEGFHILSWPFSNASGPGMDAPTFSPIRRSWCVRRVKQRRAGTGKRRYPRLPLLHPYALAQAPDYRRAGTIVDENAVQPVTSNLFSGQPEGRSSFELAIFKCQRTRYAHANLFSGQGECQRASRRSVPAGGNLRARVKHWHFEGRMPEGFSPANASPLQLPQTRFRARSHARTRYHRGRKRCVTSNPQPETSNQQPLFAWAWTDSQRLRCHRPVVS